MNKPDETRNFYEDLTKRANQRERLARDTEAFLAGAGCIEEIPRGVGKSVMGMTPKQYKELKEGGEKGAAAANIAKGAK